jgi:hypothetical protein
MREDSQKGFASILGLLFALAIIFFIFYLIFNTYFQQSCINKSDQKAVSEPGINTANYGTILDTTRSKIKDIEKQAEEHENWPK